MNDPMLDAMIEKILADKDAADAPATDITAEEHVARIERGMATIHRMISVVAARPMDAAGSATEDVEALTTAEVDELLRALEVLTIILPLMHRTALDVLTARDTALGLAAMVRGVAALGVSTRAFTAFSKED